MSDRVFISEGDCDFDSGLDGNRLFKNGNEYSAYWSNGEKTTSCTVYAGDKYTAEDELKDAFIGYWLKDNNIARKKIAMWTIRSASMSEIGEIADCLNEEVTARERIGLCFNATQWLERKGVRRVKDITRRHYS